MCIKLQIKNVSKNLTAGFERKKIVNALARRCYGDVVLCCVAAGELGSKRGVGIEQTVQLRSTTTEARRCILKQSEMSSQDRQLICMSSKIDAGLFANVCVEWLCLK